MITSSAARQFVQKHRDLAETRRQRFGLLHGMYACNVWNSTDNNAGMFGGVEEVEDGSLYGIIDTKVAATTPLRPRIAVTPDILEQDDEEMLDEQNPEAVNAHLEHLATLAVENRRRVRFANARQRYLHYLFDQGELHRTLHKLNAMARVVPHAFLRADWNPRLCRPVLRAYSPMEIWFDEGADSWDDVEYIIHATFPRPHEIKRRVECGIYEEDLARRITYAPRPDWSRVMVEAYAPDGFVDCVPIYEVFDLVNGCVMHLTDACGDTPLLHQEQPLYQFQKNPIHYLSFIEYINGMRGLAESEVMAGPAQRLARLASIEYFAAKAGVPDYLLNMNAVDDAKSLQEQWSKPRRPGSTLQVGLRQGMEDKLVTLTPTPNVQLALAGAKATAAQDLGFRAAVPGYQRGEPEPRVAATYGALQQQAEATRRGWDIRLMQRAVVWWAEAAINIAEEFMPAHQVVTVTEQDPTGRTTGTAKVFRAKMDFRDPAEWAYAESIGTTPPEARSYFYSMEPFEDPMTKNPQAELAMDMQMLEGAASGAVPINAKYLVERIRQNRNYGPEFIDQSWQRPQAPGAQSPAGAPQTPTDTPEGGGMPPGVVPVPTPAQGSMLGGAGAPAPVPAGAGAGSSEPPFPL